MNVKIFKKIVIILCIFVTVTALEKLNVSAGVIEEQAKALTIQWLVANVYGGNNTTAAQDPNFINLYNGAYPVILQQTQAMNVQQAALLLQQQQAEALAAQQQQAALLAAQQQALLLAQQQSTSIAWTNAQLAANQVVYVTPYGKKYHYTSYCGGKNSSPIQLSVAQNRGFKPCGTCVLQ